MRHHDHEKAYPAPRQSNPTFRGERGPDPEWSEDVHVTDDERWLGKHDAKAYIAEDGTVQIEFLPDEGWTVSSREPPPVVQGTSFQDAVDRAMQKNEEMGGPRERSGGKHRSISDDEKWLVQHAPSVASFHHSSPSVSFTVQATKQHPRFQAGTRSVSTFALAMANARHDEAQSKLPESQRTKFDYRWRDDEPSFVLTAVQSPGVAYTQKLGSFYSLKEAERSAYLWTKAHPRGTLRIERDGKDLATWMDGARVETEARRGNPIDDATEQASRERLAHLGYEGLSVRYSKPSRPDETFSERIYSLDDVVAIVGQRLRRKGGAATIIDNTGTGQDGVPLVSLWKEDDGERIGHDAGMKRGRAAYEARRRGNPSRRPSAQDRTLGMFGEPERGPQLGLPIGGTQTDFVFEQERAGREFGPSLPSVTTPHHAHVPVAGKVLVTTYDPSGTTIVATKEIEHGRLEHGSDEAFLLDVARTTPHGHVLAVDDGHLYKRKVRVVRHGGKVGYEPIGSRGEIETRVKELGSPDATYPKPKGKTKKMGATGFGGLGSQPFAERLHALLKERVSDRNVRVRDSKNTGSVYVNFVNLPEGVGGEGGGAEAENNRTSFWIEGFDRKDPQAPPKGKLKIEQANSVFGRSRNMRAKTGTPDAIAGYLADYLAKIVAEVPPNFTHTKREGNPTSTSVVRKPLYGHTSPETAYVVKDYPYGFKLRTSIRYWLEKKPGKGFRFVSQTMNPKTGKWNAPKPSTYTEWAGAMFLDDQDHVVWTGVGAYTNDRDALRFVEDFPGADLSLLRPIVPQKIKYTRGRAEGRYVFTVNGVAQPMSEHEKEESRGELAVWEQIATIVGAEGERAGNPAKYPAVAFRSIA